MILPSARSSSPARAPRSAVSLRACMTAALLAAGSSCPLAAPSPAAAEIPEKEFGAAMEKYLKNVEGRATIGRALEEYVRENQEKAAKAESEAMFKNPVKIDPGDSPVKGPANAAYTVIEFSDFQCPFCKRGSDTMDALLKAYPNDVKLVFKHLPLKFHDQARPAAAAAIAAGNQGKFWEYHDRLFAEQAKLGKEFFEKVASDLKLDMDKFKADSQSPETDKKIQADSDLAAKHGIQGTPGFFVNGIAVKGAYPLDHFKKIIERLGQKK